MLWSFLFAFILHHVLCDDAPAAPRDVHVDDWLLSWRPGSEDRDVSYTVQYSSFVSEDWTDVPTCVHISVTSCNVSSTKAAGEFGCTRLRVQAQRRGLTSKPGHACSRHGDSCSPDFSLSAAAGSLTVHLNRNNSFTEEHADNAKYTVYYGLQGQRVKKYKDVAASETIEGLQQGQRYCVKVQFVYFDVPVGLSSCTQCELVPNSREKLQPSELTAIVVSVVVLLLFLPVLIYFFICQSGRIKKWLRPPYQMPDTLMSESRLECPLTVSPAEERCDVISSFSLEQRRVESQSDLEVTLTSC